MIDKKEEFKAWLQHPCTKLFEDILQKKRDEYWESATQRAYHGYFQNEKDPRATLLFGKVDGFDTVLGVLRDCQDQVQQEIKFKDTPAKEKPEIDDSVSELLEVPKDEK